MIYKNTIYIFILIIFINTNILALNTKIQSNIDLPNNHIISLHNFNDEINAKGLEGLIYNGYIFSFLETYKHFNISVDYKIDKLFYKYMSLFRVKDSDDDIDLKIAVVLPSKNIGNYSRSIPSSVLNYLIFNNKPFKLKVFDFKTQSTSNLEHIMNQVSIEGYLSIILVLTDKGINDLKNIPIASNINIFIPTVNINDLEDSHYFPSNILFGGISYKKQLDKLIENITPKQSVVYGDKSAIGANLLKYIESKELNVTVSKRISSKKTYYKKLVKLKQIDENTTIFINTPIITSSIILSNLTYYKKEMRRVLSTQINYNPSIFTLTQSQDIEKLYIANSIIDRHEKIEDINALTDNDTTYNWVNYTTTIGINHLINSSGFFTSHFDVPISDNQFIYKIEILSPKNNKFTPTIIEPDPEIETILEDDNESYQYDFNISQIFG
jgi:hypothetical protein